VSISGSYTTNSSAETFELGRRLGSRLNAHTVILLEGDLGTGKTLFTKGVAAGLGIDPAEVTSPSFTLVNEHPGRMHLYHIDLYRLESGALPELGLDEILSDENSVTVIEWAERLTSRPARAIKVTFSYVSESVRHITIESSS
jgi:tRNA threonylcarbamoyladenosine biosynthesis protein TsaE